MKKRICWLLCLLLIGGILKAQERPVKVACVGNSITEGFTLAHPETESYPAVLQRLLGNGYVVGNFGVTAHALMLETDLPYQKTTRFKEALEFLPDIVTIKLGTNDTKPWNWQHHESFKKDLNRLVDAFEQLPSHPKVYLCLPIPSDRKEWGIRDSILVSGVVPYIREVARERNLPLIDLRTPMLPHYPQDYTDGVHPNKQGAEIIAREIYRALTGKDL